MNTISRDAALDILYSMREDGDTDLRSAIHRIGSLPSAEENSYADFVKQEYVVESPSFFETLEIKTKLDAYDITQLLMNEDFQHNGSYQEFCRDDFIEQMAYYKTDGKDESEAENTIKLCETIVDMIDGGVLPYNFTVKLWW